MNKLIAYFSVLMLLHGCTTIDDAKEEEQKRLNQLNALCLQNQNHYRYADGIKQEITAQKHTKVIFIGYKEEDELKVFDFLFNSNLDLFKRDFSGFSFVPEYMHSYVELELNQSCYEMEQTFALLRANPLIQYTSYVYNNNFIESNDGSYIDLITYEDVFFVTIDNDLDIEKLNKIVAETNTDIIDSKDGKYTISATKKSKGDALQMANYFHETGLFKSVKVGWNGISNILDL